MDERRLFTDFIQALVDTTLGIILLILDLVGLVAVVIWVVDDAREGLVVGLFVLVVFGSTYLVFRKVRRALYAYEQSRPRIVFFKARQAQMYHNSSVVPGKTPTYQIL